MMIAGFILAVVSFAGFVVWIIGMTKLLANKKPKIKKEHIDEVYRESYRDYTGFSESINYVKGIRYSAEHKEGMTYAEIENGLKKKDPATVTFLQIFIGFYFFLIGLISCVGSFVVASGDNDGWYMIGFCIFFTLLFGYIVISQKFNAKDKTVN